MSTPEKGKISAEISPDVIREALESVKRRDVREGEDSPEGLEPAARDASPDREEPHSEVESLRAQLEISQSKGRELMEKLKETHERMLRAVADLDNYKKRAHKEREELQKFGNERLLKEFVPVMDNLDRALEHAKSNSDFEGLLTGVAMTRKQFEDALGRHGVKPFTAVGQPFDPHLHEAMQQVETQDVPPNHVVSELLRGFTLNERLFRPALVLVAKPAEEATAAQDSSAAENAADANTDGVPGPARGDRET